LIIKKVTSKSINLYYEYVQVNTPINIFRLYY